MPERGIASPPEITILRILGRIKRDNPPFHGKNRLSAHFLRGGQVCCIDLKPPDAGNTRARQQAVPRETKREVK